MLWFGCVSGIGLILAGLIRSRLNYNKWDTLEVSSQHPHT